MGSYTINQYDKISEQQMFQLFWFVKMVLCDTPSTFDYINDFHVKESYICQFNNSVLTYSNNPICVNQIHAYFVANRVYNTNLVDAMNIYMAVQHNCTCFNDSIIAAYVNCYVEWMNYIVYQYAADCHFRAKPVIWDISRRYDENTILQLEKGALMEIFVDEEFKKYNIDIGFYYSPMYQRVGENAAGIEIKYDSKSAATGNYYIEFNESIFHGQLVPSGILKNDNVTFWLIGTPEEYLIVYKKDLLKLLLSMNPNDAGWQDEKKFVSTKTSKGFIVKKHKLQEIAVASSISEFVGKSYKRYAM